MRSGTGVFPFYIISPSYLIPKKIISLTFIECSPSIHCETKNVGDNILISVEMKGGFTLDAKYEEDLRLIR